MTKKSANLNQPANEETHINVNTFGRVRSMITELSQIPRCTGQPVLGFDLEGNNLGRYGKTCYLQIRDYVQNTTYLIDVQELGKKAFTTTGSDGVTSLKSIMEDKDIQMVIYDCRQDADALNAHFDVQVKGVVDVQLMKMLSWQYFSEYRPGYAVTMAHDANLNETELAEWNRHKGYDFKRDYSVFERRPLPQSLKLYAVNDVQYLLRLYDTLSKKLTLRGMEIALEWSQREAQATWADGWVSTRALVDGQYSKYWREKLHVSANI